MRLDRVNRKGDRRVVGTVFPGDGGAQGITFDVHQGVLRACGWRTWFVAFLRRRGRQVLACRGGCNLSLTKLAFAFRPSGNGPKSMDCFSPARCPPRPEAEERPMKSRIGAGAHSSRGGKGEGPCRAHGTFGRRFNLRKLNVCKGHVGDRRTLSVVGRKPHRVRARLGFLPCRQR